MKKTSKKNAVLKTAIRDKQTEHIGLVNKDAYLEPFEEAIRGRHEHALWKLNALTGQGKRSLSDFARPTNSRLHV